MSEEPAVPDPVLAFFLLVMLPLWLSLHYWHFHRSRRMISTFGGRIGYDANTAAASAFRSAPGMATVSSLSAGIQRTASYARARARPFASQR